MIIFPGSKVNLGLRITEKRDDGYHNLQTIFYPLSYSDVLEAIPADNTSFSASGIAIPGASRDNLILKAVERLKQYYDIPGFQIHLHKVVPPGTGLGGGSADAAGIIKMVNELAKLQLTHEKMTEIASELGADCAFFIKKQPVYATGKGDRFKSVGLTLKGVKIVLVIPNTALSTGEAYRRITPAIPEEPLDETILRYMKAWPDFLFNDFEKIDTLPPEILQIKKQLYKAGASYAAMSGSGSAVFGVFDKGAEIDPKHFAPHHVHVEKAEH